MISNNKILTVSYGTFSCTLEGFDDSFGTMKAIAEYFRDLAADDRYFGAEPPQPDAEMLTRIAQKEISRRVEAREHEGRIVLSAHEERAPSALVAAAAMASKAAAGPTAEAEAPISIETQAAPSAQEPEFAEQSLTPETAVDAAASVNASIRVDIQSADMPIEESVSVEEDAVESIGLADRMVDSALEAESDHDELDDAGQKHTADIVPDMPDADVEAFFSDANSDIVETYETDAAEDMVAPSILEKVPAAAMPRRDSIADKLRRIRAVVSQHRASEDEPDYLEDEHADHDAVADAPSLTAEMVADESEEDEQIQNDVMRDTLRDLSKALMTDDEAEKQTARSYDDEVEDRASEEETHDDLEDENDDVSDILYRLGQAERVDAEESQSSIFADTVVSDLVAGAMSDNADSPQAHENFFESDQDELYDDEADMAPQEDNSEIEQQPRARVIKVKKVELEAAISSGELEEMEDGDNVGRSSSLSDQAEAELAHELAELASELNPQDGGFEDVASTDDADETDELDEILESNDEYGDDSEDERHSSARNMLPAIDAEGDTDISRLLAETNSQMGNEESATRRDAFAHLRAAVAAKKADVEACESDADLDSDDAYREDLASVVRPRRPATAMGRTARPNTDVRPAPLKLVAEQRIDMEKVRSAGPIRPRRVAAMPDNVLTNNDSDSFAEYAANMGAHKLPELLEAAASYMSFVEGRAQFSRPQLMTKVRQVEQDDFSREDGLRSFGKLLRDGKIEKIKGGRFQVSEQIGFKPDERAAG